MADSLQFVRADLNPSLAQGQRFGGGFLFPATRGGRAGFEVRSPQATLSFAEQSGSPGFVVDWIHQAVEQGPSSSPPVTQTGLPDDAPGPRTVQSIVDLPAPPEPSGPKWTSGWRPGLGTGPPPAAGPPLPRTVQTPVGTKMRGDILIRTPGGSVFFTDPATAAGSFPGFTQIPETDPQAPVVPSRVPTTIRANIVSFGGGPPVRQPGAGTDVGVPYEPRTRPPDLRGPALDTKGIERMFGTEPPVQAGLPAVIGTGALIRAGTQVVRTIVRSPGLAPSLGLSAAAAGGTIAGDLLFRPRGGPSDPNRIPCIPKGYARRIAREIKRGRIRCP